jgi:3'-5' exoribonuclease
MKNIFVENLKPGISFFDEEFAIKNIQNKITKNGKPYLDLELSDKTGSIKAKVWSEAIAKVGELKAGSVYAFDGAVQNDSYGLGASITKATEVDNIDTSAFVPKSSKDVSSMKLEFESYIERIKNKHLKKLVWDTLDDEMYQRFLKSPAAYYIHHAYENGLLEHTLDMLKMSEPIKDAYPKINYDLLLTGIIFHDLGKVFEYSLGTAVGVTTEGKLLGHIFMGAEYVKSKADKGMPKELLDEVIHMILAHQGQLEFGSPIKPKTTEAVALYHLDDASTKINAAYHVIHGLEKDTEFAPYHKQLGVELYRSSYLDELTNADLPF